MTRHLVCPDVSEFQRPLDRTFTRDFLIMRVTFGDRYLDPKFLANASAAKRLHEEGRLAGVLLYVVYTAAPVRSQFEATWDAIGPRVPPWLTGIMIDVETWRGKDYELHGDHTARINKLYGLHAQRLRNWNSVIAYGNVGDLHELYRGRDPRCRVIVASYGSQLAYRKVRGAIGQQYTDGKPKWDVPKLAETRLPRASAPFGACDHNVFPGIRTGRDLVQLLRPEQLHGGTPPPRPPAVKAPATKVAAKKVAAKKVAAKAPAKTVAAKAPAKVATPVAPKVVTKVAPTPPTPPDATTPAVVVPGGSVVAVHPGPAATVPNATVHTNGTGTVASPPPVRTEALTSRNGAYHLVLLDDGTLEIRRRIVIPDPTVPGGH